MKYITYLPEYNNKKNLVIGGFGHSFCDYLVPYIISKLDSSFIFLNNKLLTVDQNTYSYNMDIESKNDNYFWNNYLNLDELSNNISLENIKYKELEHDKSFGNINLEQISQLHEDNTIYFFSNNNRIYLFDLYQYELLGFVKKNITQNIINDLRNVFYEKHHKLNKEKYLINIYIRRGDLYEHKIKNNINCDFEFNLFNFIYNKVKKNIDKFNINIISAGIKYQMDDLNKYFENYNNVNLLLNQKEEDVFYLMTQSDLLVFNESSFPLFSSLYCDGLIIKNKNDDYFSNVVKFKDITFLDNYIFINNSNELDKELDDKLDKELDDKLDKEFNENLNEEFNENLNEEFNENLTLH
jgi:hypothetical protein